MTANGLTSLSAYDDCGNLLTTTDPLGHTVSSTSFNTNASQVANVSSGGNNTSFIYNPDTTLGSVTGSNSDTASFTYASYRPTIVYRPDGTYTQYSYQDTANPVTQTETSYLGRVTVTTFDGFGRVIKTAVRETASPEVWISTDTVYSACSCSSTGKAVKTSRPYRGQTPGAWTETLSDALGRPTEQHLLDGSGNLVTNSITTYSYSIDSSLGPLASSLVTDPAGKQKQYFYDAFGRLIRVKEPNGSGTLIETARYTYDLMGRMTQVQMPKADGSYTQTRTFNYNTKGQLTSATNPENGTVSYTYLADGMVESKTDAKTQKLWFFYDTNHRLLRIESPQGTPKTTFTYDTDSTIATSYATGRMTTASNDGYTWHYAYDLMGRVNKQTLETPFPLTACSNAAGFIQAQYGYDGEGRLKDFYYPGSMGCAATVQRGEHQLYSYDLLGRMLNLTYEYEPGTFYTLAQGAQYNAAGQITSWQEGATLTRTYDPQRGWLTDLTAGYSLNFHYNYLANGRVSSVTDNVNPGQSATYTYDNLNRLASATANNWNMAWGYDEFGNRTSQTGAGATGQPTPPQSTLTYDQTTNRITSLVYDANGNTTWQAGMNLYYDVFDRLVGTYQNQYQQTSAKYDASGRRIERGMANGTTKVYFTDPSGRLLAEYSGWSYNSENYTGQGVTLASAIKYFAGQRIGQWTDRTGNVRYANGGWKHYYPYGEEITSTTNDTYKFAQLYRDADTGIDYAMARYSSSSMGRFLTADKYGPSARSARPQSWNRYPYVGNDPVNFIDPKGTNQAAPQFGCEWTGEEWACDWSGNENDPIGGGGGGYGGDPEPPRLDQDKLTKGADSLLSKADCSGFVLDALQKGFLDENKVTSADKLDPYQRGIYDGLTAGAVIEALKGANFVAGGAAPTTTENGQTYTTIAHVDYYANGGSTVTFYNQFFDQGNTGQSQTTLHEGMHLIWNIGDINFAKALNVYKDGMGGAAASAAWDAKLKEKCK